MRFFAIACVSFFLFGCVSAAVIPHVSDKNVADLKSPETSKPVQFKKIVVKMKRGEHIGAWQGGLFCVNNGALTWKGGKLSVDSDEFTETFQEELEKYSFKTVGDTNALFEDPSSWKSEILVAGLVKDLRTNICYPMAGFGNWTDAKGEAYLKVDWQIYSKLDRSVVHQVTTEGASVNNESTSGGDAIAVLNAFSQATRNLLSDEKFRQIVSKGGHTVTETVTKSGENIVVSTGSAKAVGEKPEDWTKVVTTVFAGGGHGSGFVISEDLVITNHHVVSGADTIIVKLSNGMQVLGEVVATNSARDVALIKVKAKLPEFLKLSKKHLVVGDEVYAVGSPLDENFKSTLSRGIVSGFRELDGKNYIQSDVNVLPGNSGGPLVTKDGLVVGVTVSGLRINDAPQGINFFIPINDAIKALNVEL